MISDPTPAVPSRPAPTNGFAVAGLVLAFGSLIVPIVAPAVGILMSVLGLRRAGELEAAGVPRPLSRRTLALFALVLAIALLALELIAAVVLVLALVLFANAGGFSG